MKKQKIGLCTTLLGKILWEKKLKEKEGTNPPSCWLFAQLQRPKVFKQAKVQHWDFFDDSIAFAYESSGTSSMPPFLLGLIPLI